MSKTSIPRRRFLKHAAGGLAGATAAATAESAAGLAGKTTLAALGGKPVRTEPFPGWPVIGDPEREAWKKVLEEKHWCRLDGQYANRFETKYAELTGTRHCVATANGTSALYAALNALGVGPGDEVIVPPYTFVATINVVLLQYALPVFVDSDRDTSQIDARKIEAAITPRTRCIMPVHLGGNAADVDTILAVAARHKIPVVEDTCQSHLAEWRGKKLGSFGKAGCFSFQASKNLNSGEGGAVISNDDAFVERCFAFHNNGRGRSPRGGAFAYPFGGANLRMTEFQACLLLQQMNRIEEFAVVRDQNGKYLNQLLQEIPGIQPARSYPGCTRNAYHLYMFRYDKEQFGGAPRSAFLKALRAEGIPVSSGYSPLNKEPFLQDAFDSEAYKRIYSADTLRELNRRNHCPENDRLCEEAVWLYQAVLLGKRSDMEQIAEAVRKVHSNAADLKKVV